MNANDAFDARVRALHAQSLDRLSPRVQAQLAHRRRGALAGDLHRHRGLLPWAGAATAAIALAFALQLSPPSSTRTTHSSKAPVAAVTTSAAADSTATVDTDVADAGAPDADAMLSEDPEFYLWLASNDAQPIQE